MNQPDRYSKFVMPEGVQKCTYAPDTKLTNAGTFMFMQEDHTMGNLIRMQLHADRSVVFAGYRIPHPLENKMVVKIMTTGHKSPIEAMEHALEDLRSEVNRLGTEFDAACERCIRQQGVADHPMH